MAKYLKLPETTCLAVTALALSACGSSNFKPETATSVAVSESLPSPSIADIYDVERVARLGPGDRVEVEVLGVSDLDRTLTIDGSGRVDFPLVGPVTALGLTTGELASELEARLARNYLQDPQVTVTLDQQVSQRFTVLGSVGQPGQYPLIGDATLTDAISLARGTSETARLDEVVVFRTVEGQRMAARFDLQDILGGRAEDPAIYPRDRIVVGSDRNRTLLRDAVAFTPILGLFYTIF